MENQIREMKKQRIGSFILMGAALLISLVFHDKAVSIGIVLGWLIGFIGYKLTMWMEIRGEQQAAFRSLYFSYVLRLIFYLCMLAFCIWLGVQPLALLIGFLCHKLIVILYAYMTILKK